MKIKKLINKIIQFDFFVSFKKSERVNPLPIKVV